MRGTIMSEKKKVRNIASDLYLADWSEQMAQVLKSGLTIEDGLELIRDDTDTGTKEQQMLDQMIERLKQREE
jgi:type IV pilus assembly protein PilC